MTERDFAIYVVRRLRDAGYQALFAGGCVRDELLSRVPKDYDVATNARPPQVRRLFPQTVPVGAAFGVIDVIQPRPDGDGYFKVQVATFRSDISYSDGRHPDAVVFSSACADAERRDFTINGLFCDPLEKRLIDYVGGQEDLKNRVLRAIGAPLERFAEDKLRILRGVRMALRFDLRIEPTTLNGMRTMARQIGAVSAERIAEELRQILVHPRRAWAMNLMLDVGLVGAVLPELLPMKGLPQGPPAAPTGDLWDHVLRVMDLLGPDVSFPLAFATLLHDVGKPRVVGRTPDRYTFYYHEHVGKRMAEEIGRRLKLSNEERERIEWLVEKHQFLCDAPRMRVSKLKRTMAHSGIEELLALHRADAMASGRSTEHVEFCAEQLRAWLVDGSLKPEPILNGGDLIAHGLKPGPHFKGLLDAVYDAQLEGSVRDKAEALALVDRLLAEGNRAP